jgi:hypothetical protein
MKRVELPFSCHIAHIPPAFMELWDKRLKSREKFACLLGERMVLLKGNKKRAKNP